jgi:hypothetical protein
MNNAAIQSIVLAYCTVSLAAMITVVVVLMRGRR